jgi:hypothetical protein
LREGGRPFLHRHFIIQKQVCAKRLYEHHCCISAAASHMWGNCGGLILTVSPPLYLRTARAAPPCLQRHLALVELRPRQPVSIPGISLLQSPSQLVLPGQRSLIITFDDDASGRQQELCTWHTAVYRTIACFAPHHSAHSKVF